VQGALENAFRLGLFKHIASLILLMGPHGTNPNISSHTFVKPCNFIPMLTEKVLLG
jgi:hypothetical protein